MAGWTSEVQPGLLLPPPRRGATTPLIFVRLSMEVGVVYFARCPSSICAGEPGTTLRFLVQPLIAYCSLSCGRDICYALFVRHLYVEGRSLGSPCWYRRLIFGRVRVGRERAGESKTENILTRLRFQRGVLHVSSESCRKLQRRQPILYLRDVMLNFGSDWLGM